MRAEFNLRLGNSYKTLLRKINVYNNTSLRLILCACKLSAVLININLLED